MSDLAAYLEKNYGSKKEKKKKKKKVDKHTDRSTVKIIDNEVFIPRLTNDDSGQSADECLEENLPTVAGLENSDTAGLWKSIDDGASIVTVTTELEKKSGLSSGKDLKNELKLLRKAEMKRFSEFDDELTGKNAKTVSRRKPKDEKEEAIKKEAADRLKETYDLWKGGVAQNERMQERKSEFEHEAKKDVARYAGDKDLEDQLKDVIREGDPMANLVSKKSSKKQESNMPSLPQCPHKGPPNRYGIVPGYRWDGVDRSTGFENKLFNAMASKRATESAAYKWSTEDM